MNRSIETYALPEYSWLPATLTKQVARHNLKVGQLAGQWAGFDRDTEQALNPSSPLEFNSTKLAQVKSGLFDGLMACIRESASVLESIPGLVEKCRALALEEHDKAIASQQEIEAQLIANIIKEHYGKTQEEFDSVMLPRVQGQARSTPRFREAVEKVAGLQEAQNALARLAGRSSEGLQELADTATKAIRAALKG